MIGKRTGRWVLTLLVITIATGVALWPRSHPEETVGRPTFPEAVTRADRAAAALDGCVGPTATSAPAIGGPLRGIALPCLADGRTVPLTAMMSGKPAVIVLWAYWCQPCARELPILASFAHRAAGVVTVVTVHSDPDGAAALARLRDLDIHLPGVQDSTSAVRTAVAAPDALPETILLRPDGNVAATVVRPFVDTNDVAATVARHLGVAV